MRVTKETTVLKFRNSVLGNLSALEMADLVVGNWLPDADADVDVFMEGVVADYGFLLGQPKFAENLLLCFAPQLIVSYWFTRYIETCGSDLEGTAGDDELWGRIRDAAEFSAHEFCLSAFEDFDFSGFWIWRNIPLSVKAQREIVAAAKAKFQTMLKWMHLDMASKKGKYLSDYLGVKMYFHVYCYLALAVLLRAELGDRYPEVEFLRMMRFPLPV